MKTNFLKTRVFNEKTPAHWRKWVATQYNPDFEVGGACLCGTPVLLRCYYAFVLTILEYCSLVWGSAAECHQLLEHQVYSVARLCPDQPFLSL